MADEPPSLAVGTGVSAKYKGAFCEAKIRKVVRSVKCKVLFKNGLGSFTVADDQIKGVVRTGAAVEARHPEKKEFSEATITKIQDCSQYTVVFDDGDITTLRRTALCLKSGKHFAESETLDQLPLTHPEHFSTPVIGGRRGRRTRIGASEASSDEDGSYHPSSDFSSFKEADIGRVVCVEGGEKRKNRDNWFPGLIVAPTAQESVPIRVRDEYLVRSFKDGRYYTVPKKEIMDFNRELGAKAETNSLKAAVEKALQFLDRDELPLHWDRDLLLFGTTEAGSDSDPGDDNESSDDEPREKKDHFVAQLYKFMDENGTPINEEPVIGSKDVDLFRLYKVVHNLGGFNRVTNQNNWKNVSVKLGFGHNPVVVGLVKQSYKKYLFSFEEWPKRPGCAMQIQPRLSRSRSRIGRGSNLKDRSCPSPTIKTEKEKSVEKVIPVVPEPPPIPTPSKPVPVPSKEPVVAPVKPPTTPTPKEKITNKKTPQVTPSTASNVKSTVETVRPPVKEVKVEPGQKLRNPKQKTADSDVIVVKQEIKIEKTDDSDGNETSATVVKEKKKRVVPRVQKKEIPLVKGGKVDCLANSRQKRVIKERLKTVAESLKARTKSSASSLDGTEKVATSKTKIKEESSASTKTHKKEKEDPSASVSTADEKNKKGRKRKEKSETFDENYEDVTKMPTPTLKTISLGDKLKVYYGPTKEAKVTSYDAKVLSTKEEDGETLYYVHYLGWNVRYDEWIRANRIAEVLGAGRSPKKQTQAPTTPKSGKKEKKAGKTETPKLDKSSVSKEPIKEGSFKDHSQGRQGSVGRSTTPCSVTSTSSRSKGPAQKRPKTRAAQSKKGEDIVDESESDAGSEAEELKTEVNPVRDEPDEEAKIGKSEQSEDEVQDEPEGLEAEVEAESTESKSVSGAVKQKAKEDESEAIKVEAEVEEEEEDEDEEEEDEDGTTTRGADEEDDEDEEENKDYDVDDFDLILANSVIKEELSDDSVGRGTPLLGFDAPSSEAMNKDANSLSIEDVSREKVPSESENSEPGVEDSIAEDSLPAEIKEEAEDEEPSTAVKSEPSDDESQQPPEAPPAPMEMEAEDVYEFKEPEPFEFEARKSDDKSKGTKRALCSISIDDKPPSPKYRKVAVSPARDTSSKSSYQSPTELLSKDDNSPESTPTIQTCEEVFDKICASPLRAATLDSRGTALLDNMENYEDDDNFDDDSEDRLVISERDSDNCSNISFETGDAPDLTKPTAEPSRDSQPEPLEKSKPKAKSDEEEEDEDDENDNDEEENEEEDDEEEDGDEEEEDDAMESEALKATEQVESSDDLSEEEPQQKASEKIPITEVLLTSASAEEELSKMPETIDIPLEVDVKPEEPAVDTKALEKSPDVIDKPDESLPKEEKTDKDEEAEKEQPQNDEKEEKVPDEADLGETVDAEEDENNLESLICEETIPGSPPSHLEVLCQIEDKRRNEEVALFKNDSELSKSLSNDPDKLISQVSRDGRSPSTTPESNESSTPSPSRESVAQLVQNEKQTEKDTAPETTLPPEPSTFKKETGKSSEGRTKKVENKTPAKRGRKSKKKSEEGNSTSKRKYGRHSKHQGSESDDGYDLSGGNRSDSSSSRAHHPYRKNFLIPADELSAMDVSQRIARITQAMQDLRTTFNNHKTELAAIDKRRKRIRRREREDAARMSAARSH